MRRMMFVTLLVLLAAAMSAAQQEQPSSACGPDSERKYDLKITTDKMQLPVVPPDKAVVYVFSRLSTMNRVVLHTAMDGKWIGANRETSFFYVLVAPGVHRFCLYASAIAPRAFLQVDAKAGQAYYVEQGMKSGFMKSRFTLEAADPDDGAAAVAASHQSSISPKKES